MTTTTPATDFTPRPAAPAAAAARPGERVRDLRLDFFRGIAMFIILIAHSGNPWTRWIPARFGFSDATEIFVFCSGMASAIAFGATFARAGFAIGTARTAFRIWQVYWAHVGLFFFVAMMLAAIDTYGSFEKCYICALNLTWFFDDTAPQIVGLFTLTYVPNYFDILPMYLVILAMMPAMIALARIHVYAALGASVAVWLAANVGLLALPAEPWSDRQWFFNPFGWQLVFFTGFALMAGWLPRPPVNRALIWAAIAFLVLTMPLSSPHAVTFLKATWPAAAEWSMETYPKIRELRLKSEFGILRYVHFLALAYLAWVAVGAQGHRLVAQGAGTGAAAWNWTVAQIVKVGQQSLAVFVFSMAFARVMSFAFDMVGRTPSDWPTTLAINLVGFAALIGVAYLAGWVKSSPWRAKKPAAA
jgi:hypothetical protein